jgi:hypothetical protein
VKLDLDEIEAAAKAASPGPWRIHSHGGVAEDANARFIGTVDPSKALALVARLRAAEALLAEVLDDCEERGCPNVATRSRRVLGGLSFCDVHHPDAPDCDLLAASSIRMWLALRGEP